MNKLDHFRLAVPWCVNSSLNIWRNIVESILCSNNQIPLDILFILVCDYKLRK